MTIGERIKNRRIELGISQIELAKRMGIKTKSTICQLENSGDNITTDRIRRAANALFVSESFLMGWEDSPKNMPEPKLEHFALIEKYEMLTEPQRKLIMDTIDSLLQMNNI